MEIEAHWDVEQVMNSALRLLRDVEQQVKQSVGLAPETPITYLDEQQLRAVPQALLTKLSETMEVVQQLRSHASIQASTGTLPADDSDNATESSALTAQPEETTQPTHKLIAQRTGKCRFTVACQPVANKQVPCTVQNQHAPSHPAQRSAASNDRAVVKELRTHTCGQTQAEWLVSKGRQQQDAAAAAEEFMRKEQVSVCRLQAKQQTALGAHQQALRDIQEVAQSAGSLQVLLNADDQWQEYLGMIKSNLNTE